LCSATSAFWANSRQNRQPNPLNIDLSGWHDACDY